MQHVRAFAALMQVVGSESQRTLLQIVTSQSMRESGLQEGEKLTMNNLRIRNAPAIISPLFGQAHERYRRCAFH
jgi:hypothetical protein